MSTKRSHILKPNKTGLFEGSFSWGMISGHQALEPHFQGVNWPWKIFIFNKIFFELVFSTPEISASTSVGCSSPNLSYVELCVDRAGAFNSLHSYFASNQVTQKRLILLFLVSVFKGWISFISYLIFFILKKKMRFYCSFYLLNSFSLVSYNEGGSKLLYIDLQRPFRFEGFFMATHRIGHSDMSNGG